MTDFFDDLERQLVTATPQRAARIRRARARRAAATASVLVVLLAGGAGIATALGSGDGDPAGAPAGTAAATTAAAPPPAITDTSPEPDAFTTAVLNATTVPGLARGVANRLQNQRFKIGNVTNAATQDRSETKVFFRDATCVPAAREVAAALRLYDASGGVRVFPATAAQRLLAGRGADVIVAVGSDQNNAVGP